MKEQDVLKQAIRKNLFFGGMQGELNSGFCTLKMGLELLERQLKHSEIARSALDNLTTMSGTLRRMERISGCVEDVLLGSAGALEPCIVNLEMGARVRAAADVLVEESRSRTWQAQVHCSLPEGKVWAAGDEAYAEQMLCVLTTNAVRCEQVDTVVTIELDEQRRLRVTDNSPRIPPNAVEAILGNRFEERFLTDSGLLGLQLYLARLYCDAMDWKLTLNSTAEQTTVTVEMAECKTEKQANLRLCSGGNHAVERLRSSIRADFDDVFGTAADE